MSDSKRVLFVLTSHSDHVVKLVGIDHVGIGSDADLLGYDALCASEIPGQGAVGPDPRATS